MTLFGEDFRQEQEGFKDPRGTCPEVAKWSRGAIRAMVDPSLPARALGHMGLLKRFRRTEAHPCPAMTLPRAVNKALGKLICLMVQGGEVLDAPAQAGLVARYRESNRRLADLLGRALPAGCFG